MFALPFFSLLIACSSNEYSTGAVANDSYRDQASSDSGYWDEEMDADAGEAPESDEGFDDGLGSETEEAAARLLPASTNQFVFVANPDRNTVTRIDVQSLEVRTAAVGTRPILVETSSDYSKAVTFNAGSNSISIIDSSTMESTDVKIRSNLNQMKMSPDGNWVLCYHDINSEESNLSGGAISYNAMSIVNLTSLEHIEAVVGSHPHDIQFTADSSIAVVISDDYLATIDLSSDSISPKRIAIADDLIHPPKAEEVLLDPDGKYAIVRQYGVDELVLVDLQADTPSISMLEVGANPTDMDVSKDGSKALVVARVAKEVWIYDLVDPTLEAEIIALPEDEIFGGLLLSPNDDYGILYSTVSGQSRIGVWDRSNNEIISRGLVKPVSGVEFSPNGDTVVLFHDRENGDTPFDSPFYNRYAISLMAMDDLFTSSYQLSNEPDSFAHTADGRLGFYTMKNLPYLEILDYRNFVPDEIILPSNPVHLGSLPDTNTVFISQEHSLGRISFFDSDEQNLQTITGFELNAAIEE